MEILKGILLVLHIIGFGGVFGVTLAQMTNLKSGTAKVSKGLLHSALLILVTGLALVGMVYATGGAPDNAKITVKLVVLLALIVTVIINSKKEKASGGVLGAILALSTVNVAVAVLW